MPSLAAGKLRHRITFQHAVETRSEYGEVSTEWQDYVTVWGNVAPQSAREFEAAAQVQEQLKTRFIIRYREDVEYTFRIVFRHKKYDIKAIIPDSDSGLEHLTIECEEIVK